MIAKDLHLYFFLQWMFRIMLPVTHPLCENFLDFIWETSTLILRLPIQI